MNLSKIIKTLTKADLVNVIKTLSREDVDKEMMRKEYLNTMGCNKLYAPIECPKCDDDIYLNYSKLINEIEYGTSVNGNFEHEKPNNHKLNDGLLINNGQEVKSNGKEVNTNNYGDGPTRIITRALYDANEIIILEDIELLNGKKIPLPTKALNAFLKLEDAMSCAKHYDVNFNNYDNFYEISRGVLKDKKRECVRLDIADVVETKKGFTGTLLIHSSEFLGSGYDLVKGFEHIIPPEIKTIDAFMPEHYEKTKLMFYTNYAFKDQLELQEHVKQISEQYDIKKILGVYRELNT